MTRRLIDLSHTITDGMVTYPGLPAPVIADHLSRDAAEEIYGPGVRFQIGMLEICTNTGTYLDVPFHRFDSGFDLSELALDQIVGVPAVCFDRVGERAIALDDVDLSGLDGHVVLIRTDHCRHFGTDGYATDAPHLTAEAADRLVDAGVVGVGIDSVNIDSLDDTTRPVHTRLLGEGIVIIEHLRGLDELPIAGFTFTAVPPKVEGVGTFTVRAFAELNE